MDMHFYWLRDRALEQKQLHVHWKRGETTKHFPVKHHVEIRPIYVANIAKATNTLLVAALSAVRKGVLESYSQITHPTGITTQTTGSSGYFPKAHEMDIKCGRYYNSL